jgi:hypothetical protein
MQLPESSRDQSIVEMAARGPQQAGFDVQWDKKGKPHLSARI